jgi:hypothetical protein
MAKNKDNNYRKNASSKSSGSACTGSQSKTSAKSSNATTQESGRNCNSTNAAKTEYSL